MKKLYLLIIAALLIAQGVMAQPDARARKSMNLFNYTKAVKILKRAAKKEKYRETAIPLLAECYKMQRDVANAKEWYAQAVQLPNATANTWFDYSSALIQAGEYAQAKSALASMAKIAPADPPRH